MKTGVFRDMTIRELQKLAHDEISRRGISLGVSRAARLFLIHRLSQSGGLGLWALVAAGAAAIFASGAAAPARVAAWAAMTLGAFAVARVLMRRYRVGEKCSARPFKWRADYVAALVVLAAAYGAGALLLAPAGASAGQIVAVLAVLGVGGLVAALRHAAHLQAVNAIVLPIAGFCVFSALRAPGAQVYALYAAGAAAGVWLISYYMFKRHIADARRRHPVDAYLAAVGATPLEQEERDGERSADGRDAA